MPLRKLEILNFQRHEKLRIRFDEKLTTITGPSDSGKSSVIRAVRWAMTNRPRGTGFVRDGQSSVGVRLWIDDSKIERSKDKRRNRYELDGRGMEAVSGDVPESVADLLNVDGVNFQGQHDGPFWFGLTPGEVAKRINSIVDLGLIDETQANVASVVRRVKLEIEVAADGWEEAKARKAGLNFVPLMDGKLKLLEGRQREASRLRGLCGVLTAFVSEGMIYRDRRETLSEAELEGSEVASRGRSWRKLAGELLGLVSLMTEAKEARQRLDRPVPDASRLGRLKGRMEELRRGVDSLSGLLDRSTDAMEKTARAGEDVGAAERRLKKETKGLCPVCGRPWKEK